MIDSCPLTNFKPRIAIQTKPFDLATEQELIWQGKAQIGALVTFVGRVRDCTNGSALTQMFLEHYPGMSERILSEIAQAAATKWELAGITIIHRIGTLYPEDLIVLIGVASAHRKAAFNACEFLIDALKTRAPFWKKEFTANGEFWVGQKL